MSDLTLSRDPVAVTLSLYKQPELTNCLEAGSRQSMDRFIDCTAMG